MKDRHKLKPAWQNIDWSSIDPNSYLLVRETPHLEVLWDAACAALLANQKELTPKQRNSVQREVSRVREEVFTFVTNVIEHENFALQIADDMALIQEAYWHAVTDDPYINALAQAYTAGRLPMREDFI